MSGLSVGDSVASVRLVEPVVRGQRISCWRGEWPDGAAATVHALHHGARPREQENFLNGARRLQSLQRGGGLPGVVVIGAVAPHQHAYVSRQSVAGTMEDVPVLQWGVREIVNFVRSLCTAMLHLHRAGVVHGCLRPANVLLDDNLKPVVSDPGLVNIDDSYEGSSQAVHDYSPYAAREVRIGHVATVQSDVFSVGRLIHFCLLGETPDEADEELPLLVAIETAPAALVRIVRKCTTRDPVRRYASIDAVLEDLERYEQQGSVGLTHPHGREGAASVSERPPDTRPAGPPSIRPDADDETPTSERPAPDRRQAGTPGQARRDPAAARRQTASPRAVAAGSVRADGQTLMVARGADDDILSVLQARLGMVAGVVLVGIAVALGYYRGTSTAALSCSVLGAVGLSLAIPAWGVPLVSRGLAALFLAAAVWFLDPVGIAAKSGRVDRFTRGNPVARGQRIHAALRAGDTDFRGLDLRQVRLENMTLSGARFDQSKLTSASFRASNLTGASFSDSVITDVDFRGADLRDVDFSATVDWSTTKCDLTTRMPEGWGCDGKPVQLVGLSPTEPSIEQRPDDGAKRLLGASGTKGQDPLRGNLGSSPEPTASASAGPPPTDATPPGASTPVPEPAAPPLPAPAAPAARPGTRGGY